MFRLLTRVLLLLAIVVIVQIGVLPYLRPLSNTANHLLVGIAPDHEVILFCDSTNRWTATDDADRRSIGDMTAACFPELKLGQADGNGLHAEVFETAVERIASRSRMPKVIIVPINLRSFCLAWRANPNQQLDALVNEIRYSGERWRLGALAFTKMFPRPSSVVPAYESLPVFCGEQPVGQVMDFDNHTFKEPDEAKAKKKFILHYMYPLSAESQRLQSLVRLARTATQQGSQVIFYVTPIDVDSGIAHLGAEFQQQVAKNIAVIREQLQPTKAHLIDLSCSMPTDVFTYENYPDEHLNQDGRAFIASALRHELHQAGIRPLTDAALDEVRYVYRPGHARRTATGAQSLLR